MNQQWKDFLQNQGYTLSQDHGATRLTSASSEDGAGDTRFTALTHSALLQVSGPDSEKFLQGQLTCDVTKITTAMSNPGAACTPQGRVYSNFQLIKSSDQPIPTFYMRMHSGIIESTQQTLGKYAVFFKTELASLSEDFVGIGIWGDHCASLLSSHFDTLPEQPNETSIVGEQIIVRVSGAVPRFEYWGPASAAESLWSTLAAACQMAPTSAWELEDTRSGIAHITPATAESFTPHMLNYKSHNGISFEKGCYTGQEIVARTEYRGQAKRALHHLIIDGSNSLKVGSQLSVNGKSATLVTNANTAAGRNELLVVTPPEFEQGQQVAVEIDNTTTTAEIRPFS